MHRVFVLLVLIGFGCSHPPKKLSADRTSAIPADDETCEAGKTYPVRITGELRNWEGKLLPHREIIIGVRDSSENVFTSDDGLFSLSLNLADKDSPDNVFSFQLWRWDPNSYNDGVTWKISHPPSDVHIRLQETKDRKLVIQTERK